MKRWGELVTAFGSGCLLSSLIVKYSTPSSVSDRLIIIGFTLMLAGFVLRSKSKQ